MKKSRLSEHQVIKIIKRLKLAAQPGKSALSTASAAPRITPGRVNSAVWKPLIKRMRGLEYENAPLKQIFAELSLENRALKDVIEKSSKAGRETRFGLLGSRRAGAEDHEDLHRVAVEPHSVCLSGHTAGRYAGDYGAT